MVTQFSTSLAQPLNAGDTTVNEVFVASIKTTDGHVLTMSDFPFGVGYIVVDPTGTFEVIKFTGIDSSGIGFTGTDGNRGLPTYYSGGETTITASVIAHSAGVPVIISDNINWFLDHFVNQSTAQTIAGVKTFSVSPVVPTGGTGTQAANNQDIANALTGASGSATTTTFGTVKISAAPQTSQDPIALGQNDPVLTTSSGTALNGTTNKIIDTDANPVLLAPSAQGDLAYVNATPAWALLAPGTSGQFLKTQGASANPTWAQAYSSITTGTDTPSNTASPTTITSTITHGLGKTPAIIMVTGSIAPNPPPGGSGSSTQTTFGWIMVNTAGTGIGGGYLTTTGGNPYSIYGIGFGISSFAANSTDSYGNENESISIANIGATTFQIVYTATGSNGGHIPNTNFGTYAWTAIG